MKSHKIQAGKQQPPQKSQQLKTKEKTILDSPFVYKWPTLSPTQGSQLVDTLSTLLRPLSLLKSKTALERTARNTSILVKKQSFKTGKEIQETLESIKSAKIETLSIEEKMKLENEKRKLEKKRKRVDGLASGDGPDVLVSEREKKAKLESKEEDLNDTEKELTDQEKDEANCVSNALVVGINSVTKALSKGIEGDSTLRMVFVCKGDVTVTHLYAHLPMMVYLAGSDVLLVGLPLGAEPALSNALGMKAVACFGIKKISPKFDALHALVQSMVQPPNLPWVPRKTPNARTEISYMETKVKTLNVPEGKGAGGRNNRNAEKKGNAGQKGKDIKHGHNERNKESNWTGDSKSSRK